MTLWTHLLRRPATVIEQCLAERDQRRLAQLCLLAIAVGGAAFGAAVGAYRGGAQVPLAATKIPLAMLGTLAICGPAMYTLAAAFGRPWRFRVVLGLSLAVFARGSLVLLAFAPVLWLTIDWGLPYHAIKLCCVFVYALAGLSGLSVALRALGKYPGRFGLTVALCGLFLLVGGQSAWVLRPYLGDPRDAVVPVLATGAEGGGLLGALWHSTAEILEP